MQPEVTRMTIHMEVGGKDEQLGVMLCACLAVIPALAMMLGACSLFSTVLC